MYNFASIRYGYWKCLYVTRWFQFPGAGSAVCRVVALLPVGCRGRFWIDLVVVFVQSSVALLVASAWSASLSRSTVGKLVRAEAVEAKMKVPCVLESLVYSQSRKLLAFSKVLTIFSLRANIYLRSDLDFSDERRGGMKFGRLADFLSSV